MLNAERGMQKEYLWVGEVQMDINHRSWIYILYADQSYPNYS